MKNIIIKGARQHNLKNISVEIPRDKLVVITGVSGSGKSTLAFDTLYAEGQRRYVESLSTYARQFLGLMHKPEVDSIEGLSPAISIEQKTTSKNPRSTVGTTTEIYDYLRLLFARIGIPYCPEHNIPIASQTPDRIADQIRAEHPGMVTVLSPVVRQKKGTYQQLLRDLDKEGYARVRVNKKITRTDEEINLDRYKKQDIEIVIDRLDSSDRSRLTEAVENALKKSEGLILVVDEAGKESTYSSLMACPVCGIAFEELQPRMFSFNSPFGACEECHGLGVKMEFDPDLIIPDRNRCIADGAVAPYRNPMDGFRGQYLATVAKHFGFDVLTPIKDLSEDQYNALMYGSSQRMKFSMSMKNGDAHWSHTGEWEGLLPQTARLYAQTQSDYRKRELEGYMRVFDCPACRGRRLKDKVLAVRISGKSIIDVTDLSVSDSVAFFAQLGLTDKEAEIAHQIIKEIRSRLEFLEKVGLGYLTLSRNAGTLSGGEAQRIRLATQIGSRLMGVLYVLDEPSIGLHARDNARLLKTLKEMRDQGNTVLVVEHDEETIRTADWIIDLGLGAGENGGEIVAAGKLPDILSHPTSLTGAYLSRRLTVPLPDVRREGNGKHLKVVGARANNLKNIDVEIPLGKLVCITGVSGSGKSTLMVDILYEALARDLNHARTNPGAHDHIEGTNLLDKIINIDQAPIGRTPRSNPGTYTGVWDEVRKLFAELPESKMRGYTSGRFSFNVHGGRCEACQGHGQLQIEMQFLPDVYVPCDVCHGARFNRETLQVRFKEMNIADVLNMTVDTALDFFASLPRIVRRLKTLQEVGLGYIRIGQSATTLSGGEAQRVKLSKELSRRATGRTLYVLDEPSVGLHAADVHKLVEVLQRLVDAGNSVLIIEHNLDIIKTADHIIDLGPEGGDRGGQVLATGTPEQVCEVDNSFTGQVLKDYFRDYYQKTC